MEYTLLKTTLEDGTEIEFNIFSFSAAVMLAEFPTADTPEAQKETASKMASIVASVIPKVSDRPEWFRAGLGFRISRWMEAQGKDLGQ